MPIHTSPLLCIAALAPSAGWLLVASQAPRVLQLEVPSGCRSISHTINARTKSVPEPTACTIGRPTSQAKMALAHAKEGYKQAAAAAINRAKKANKAEVAVAEDSVASRWREKEHRLRLAFSKKAADIRQEAAAAEIEAQRRWEAELQQAMGAMEQREVKEVAAMIHIEHRQRQAALQRHSEEQVTLRTRIGGLQGELREAAKAEARRGELEADMAKLEAAHEKALADAEVAKREVAAVQVSYCAPGQFHVECGRGPTSRAVGLCARWLGGFRVCARSGVLLA